MIDLNLSITDGKDKTRALTIHFPKDTDVRYVLAFVEEAIGIVQTLIIGQITKWEVSIYDLRDLIPDPNADVNETAIFRFSAGGFPTVASIPTFSEDFYLPGSDLVDISNPNVARFVTMMLEGVEITPLDPDLDPAWVRPVSWHEDFIDQFVNAKEWFVKDRRKKKKLGLF